MKTILRNGQVFFDNHLRKADIAIEDGVIVEVGVVEKGDMDIDVSGKWVLPGAIDAHVHFRDPGQTDKEDFKTGSTAAAAGGVTTVLDMPNNASAITTIERLEEKRNAAKKSIIDYGLYMGGTAQNAGILKHAKNIAGIKIFMGSSTGDLLVTENETIKELIDTGKNIVIHAEDENCLTLHAKEFPKATIYEHGKIRDRVCATTALQRAITLADGKPIHIAHISTADEVEIIREAKKKGIKITCEVTPHHLFLHEELLEHLGNYGRMNPPLRTKQDCVALMQGLRDGTIDIVATDHAPHSVAEKSKPYLEAPSGVPGVETMVPLLINAVHHGYLSLSQAVHAMSITPAQMYGIQGKGKIQKGYDADIIVVDVEHEKEVLGKHLHSKCGWSPFESMHLFGWPIMTFVRGEIVYDNGEVHTHQGKEVIFT